MAPSAKVIAKLTAAAEAGDPLAQLRLGGYYLSGEGVEENPDLGIQFIKMSADQGNPDAQTELGMCYREGDGVPVDLKEAAKLFLKAAEQGQDEAQNALGLAYEAGEGVEKDLEESLKWFRSAAANGHPEAQCNLGVMYHLAQEYAVAYDWFQKSAQQGDAGGQYNLGVMFKYGRGIDQDKSKGRELLELSAAQGYDLAVAELNVADEDVEAGKGVESEDAVQAAAAMKMLGIEKQENKV